MLDTLQTQLYAIEQFANDQVAWQLNHLNALSLGIIFLEDY